MKIAPYVFRITAIGPGGQSIEATGSDEERLLESVTASILEFEDRAGSMSGVAEG
jgi:hypothetical protein